MDILSAASRAGGGALLVELVFLVVAIVAAMKILPKAGYSAWYALVMKIFGEITKEYNDVYYFYAADNVARFYPLEAFGRILAILTSRNKTEDIEKLKGDIALVYYEFKQEIERAQKHKTDYSGITKKYLNMAMDENIYKYIDLNVGEKSKKK